MKRMSKQKRFILLSCSILVFALAGIVLLVMQNGKPRPNNAKTSPSSEVNKINYNPPTSEQKNPATDNRDQPPVTQSQDNLTITLTAMKQVDDTLFVRTLITPITSGQCTLSITKPGQVSITQAVEIQALASSSSCKGFNVPTSTLAKGMWHLKVSVKSQTGNTAAVEKDVAIE